MSGQGINEERRTVIKNAGVLGGIPFTNPTTGRSTTKSSSSESSTSHSTNDSKSSTSEYSSTKSKSSESSPKEKRVVGYFPSYRGLGAAKNIPYDKLTHLNYSTLETRSSGEVYLTGGGDPKILKKFRDISRNNQNPSFMFSVRGGSRFSDAALTAERRARFAQTAVELVRKYNFDGIDIDWEYPNGRTREDDPRHFTLLLRRIRQELNAAEQIDNQAYYLSMAASPAPTNIDPLEVGRFDDLVDFVSVMNYDFYGPRSAETGFNAPLYPAPNTAPELSAHHAMMYWADQPIMREKLTFGVPFYGRIFKNVQGNRGLSRPFEESGTEGYWDIYQDIKPDADYNYYWHPKSRVPWLYSRKDDIFISYDNKHSVKEKTQYTVNHDFGGMMCWELSYDPNNMLIDTIDRHVSLPGRRRDGSRQ